MSDRLGSALQVRFRRRLVAGKFGRDFQIVNRHDADFWMAGFILIGAPGADLSETSGRDRRR